MLDRLQGAFDSQTRFLDDAGHQLRTPITIVRGHVELLDDDPEQREADVALVLDELDRMDRLVADLRVLARSGRPDFLEPEDVELSQLVEEVARKAGALADRRWAVRTGPPARLRADRHRLTEALLNLVDNAVRATQPGDTVELGTAVHGATAELWVRDTGCGIDPADVPHLFERGGNRVRHRPGGTGLGLPIVAAIAAAHGGDVTATSVPGDGTCVRLLLPTDAEEAR
jgi:signal transduction histidine kinase